jgi:hypothetical protein
MCRKQFRFCCEVDNALSWRVRVGRQVQDVDSFLLNTLHARHVQSCHSCEMDDILVLEHCTSSRLDFHTLYFKTNLDSSPSLGFCSQHLRFLLSPLSPDFATSRSACMTTWLLSPWPQPYNVPVANHTPSSIRLPLLCPDSMCEDLTRTISTFGTSEVELLSF